MVQCWLKWKELRVLFVVVHFQTQILSAAARGHIVDQMATSRYISHSDTYGAVVGVWKSQCSHENDFMDEIECTMLRM